MRKTILTLFAASLIATLAAQAADASGRPGARTKASVVATERFRNSKAYFAPADYPAPSYAPNVYDGAMGSGMAGH
jgi:hypothetical protein